MDISSFLNNPILSTGLAVTLLGSVMYSLKQAPKAFFKPLSDKFISSFVYTVRVYEYDDLFELLESWLQVHYQMEYRDVEGTLCSSINPYPLNCKKVPDIVYRQSSTVFVIKVSGKRIVISKEKEKLEYAQSFKSLYGYHYSIKGFKAKRLITDLLQKIVTDHYDKLPKNLVRMKINDKYGGWESQGSVTVKGLDKIIIPDDLKAELIADLDLFISSKQWYISTSIPYKRGFEFEGDPGTGKTSLCKAMASYLNRDIYSLNINTLPDDKALQSSFANLPDDGAILLIEDVDAIFTKRNANCNVSFSCLLNCIDGAFYKEGLILCITSNHHENLDPALYRPGRIDKRLTIGLPATKQINQYLSLFYGEPITVDCECENIMLSMALIQEICINNRGNKEGAIKTIKGQLLDMSLTGEIKPNTVNR